MEKPDKVRIEFYSNETDECYQDVKELDNTTDRETIGRLLALLAIENEESASEKESEIMSSKENFESEQSQDEEKVDLTECPCHDVDEARENQIKQSWEKPKIGAYNPEDFKRIESGHEGMMAVIRDKRNTLDELQAQRDDIEKLASSIYI